MKAPREMLGQLLGRGGRPAIVDMTAEQVRDLDPGFCERLERMGRGKLGACGPYLHRTVGELAQAEHVSVASLLAAAEQTSRGHRPWPGPRLAATVAELDLEREIEQLQAEPAWREFDRNAKTLIKNPELRIVLMTLKTGARLDQHAARGAISVQVLAGRVRLSLPSKTMELAAGELLAVGPAVRHDLEALEPSSVLLTIAEGPETSASARFEAAARRSVREHRSPDAQAMTTEDQLRPNFDTDVRGAVFAPIEGYTIVKSGPTSFGHHGFYVVDEPYKGVKPPRQHEDRAQSAGSGAGAMIPDEVIPGEAPVDVASTSLVPPTPAELGLTSSVDATYSDLRHLARGGPHQASQ
jgi:quercetin dioxygenase-like cupin family protein